MSKYNMNPDARRENMRALANALGISEEEAGVKLKFKVVLRFSRDINGSEQFVKELYELLSRTIEAVSIEEGCIHGTAEVDINRGIKTTLHVLINDNSFVLTQDPISEPPNETTSHPLFLLLTACYSSAAILKLAVPEIPFSCKLPMDFSLSEVLDPELLNKKIDLGKCYMAGAGAIGNGLLWAFRYLDIQGQLHICDDDKIGKGNLNRQLFFAEEEIGLHKAKVLAKKAQKYLPNLQLLPRTNLLQNLEEAGGGFWLSRLISAVDSRRARRALQGECPGEVFDASTTDISEIVVHYHKQPTDLACMSCIYSEDDAERSHELNIAEALSVDVSEVKKGRITAEIAEVIVKRFPETNIKASNIEGEAYDSLYKSLCGQGQLQNVENGQTLAPFCFVSVLAGVMLAIEIVKRLSINHDIHNYNLWKISAWHPPYLKIKKNLPRNLSCPNCSLDKIRALIHRAWAKDMSTDEQ